METPALIGVQVVCAVVLVVARLYQRHYSRLHVELQRGRADTGSALLAAESMPLRLEPELQWARHEGTGMGLVAFMLDAETVPAASERLRAGMRNFENAFRLDDSTILVNLWDVNGDGAALAAARLGRLLAAGGGDGIEAGWAVFPADGDDVQVLIAAAMARLEPLEAEQERAA